LLPSVDTFDEVIQLRLEWNCGQLMWEWYIILWI